MCVGSGHHLDTHGTDLIEDIGMYCVHMLHNTGVCCVAIGCNIHVSSMNEQNNDFAFLSFFFSNGVQMLFCVWH